MDQKNPHSIQKKAAIELPDSKNSRMSGARRFAHEAMAAVFEIYIEHSDAYYAEQAAYAAFEELDRLEQELSRYIENSDISRINHAANDKPIRIGLDAFDCLKQCQILHQETGGAFDATIGLLYGCWIHPDKSPKQPAAEELEFARKHTGMRRLELNEDDHTARVIDPPIHIDLGGIGKGFAVDRMGACLRDWEIDAALIHGGWSTALALDAPAGQAGWPALLRHLLTHKAPLMHEAFERLSLRRQAVSASGLRKGPHIIDPRTGQPVQESRAAWSGAPRAADADALSTAFMVMSGEEIQRFCEKRPQVWGIVYREKPGESGGSMERFGRQP
ncbi:MAG: FAD:protein FMN transferase [Candidatus Omnitrophica bacterium]|nr:FAD:protein FMN transferase [Candidatus Omnitrophota bacterium]